MTIHVAEAEEARGRVILRFCSFAPNEEAVRAAMIVARAFHSEVELLFVEDAQRVDFATFPSAKEFSRRDGIAHAVSPLAVRAEIHGRFAVARKKIAAAAKEHEIHVYEHVVHDDPVQALVSACARRGPWNMIAIAETFGSPAPFSIDEVFETVSDATGIIVAGPGSASRQKRSVSPRDQSAWSARSIVLAVEDIDHLQGMLRAAHYMAAELKTETIVLLVAATDEELAHMDAQVRLVLSPEDNVRLAPSGAIHGDQAAVADAVRRLGSEFLIVQYGGLVAPRRASLRPLLCGLDCPVLLVR